MFDDISLYIRICFTIGCYITIIKQIRKTILFNRGRFSCLYMLGRKLLNNKLLPTYYDIISKIIIRNYYSIFFLKQYVYKIVILISVSKVRCVDLSKHLLGTWSTKYDYSYLKEGGCNTSLKIFFKFMTF